MLRKFLSNQCSYKECESVAQFLEENEQELDKLEVFENLDEADFIQVCDSKKEEVLDLIFPKSGYVFGLKRFFIAASILIVGFFSLYLFNTKKNLIHRDSWVNVVNNETVNLWYLLPDSSRLMLEPNAQIAYREDFIKNREIRQKKGGVTYYVFTNKKSPFTVVNRGIQTRAIGTIFKISDHSKDELIIKLLDGQIVVEEVTDVNKKQVYLKQSSTLIVNIEDFSYEFVESEKPSNNKKWSESRVNSKIKFPLSSIVWSNHMIDFNGVSNLDFFNVIESLFSVTVVVLNPEIAKGNFTGKIYKEDNIDNIFRIFCEINSISYTVEGSVITIE